MKSSTPDNSLPRRDQTPSQPHKMTRRNQILNAASSLFARNGFEMTSLRDIARASGILAGSIYHHFASKEELFIEAHAAGLAAVKSAVLSAIEGITDPWARLNAAATTHCRMLLEGEPAIFSKPWIPVAIIDYRDDLVRPRDEYENIIKQLISDLPLRPDLDRNLFRLHFLGALNWVPQWYRPDSGLSPEEIGRGLVRMLQPDQPR